MACRLPGRTYVLGGAHDLSQLSHGGEPSGQPEVHDLDVPRGSQSRQQDVLRLKQKENDASDSANYTTLLNVYCTFRFLYWIPSLAFLLLRFPSIYIYLIFLVSFLVHLSHPVVFLDLPLYFFLFLKKLFPVKHFGLRLCMKDTVRIKGHRHDRQHYKYTLVLLKA